MKKLLKCIAALSVLAAAAGGVYYVWKNKMGKDDGFDDLDDLDDFDDLDDDSGDDEEEESDEDERGYVTLKLHKDETEAEEA